MATTSDEFAVVCKFFLEGRCRFGRNCRNLHVNDAVRPSQSQSNTANASSTSGCQFFHNGRCLLPTICRICRPGDYIEIPTDSDSDYYNSDFEYDFYDSDDPFLMASDDYDEDDNGSEEIERDFKEYLRSIGQPTDSDEENEIPATATTSTSENREICQYFLEGICRYGSNCWNRHPENVPTNNNPASTSHTQNNGIRSSKNSASSAQSETNDDEVLESENENSANSTESEANDFEDADSRSSSGDFVPEGDADDESDPVEAFNPEININSNESETNDFEDAESSSSSEDFVPEGDVDDESVTVEAFNPEINSNGTDSEEESETNEDGEEYITSQFNRICNVRQDNTSSNSVNNNAGNEASASNPIRAVTSLHGASNSCKFILHGRCILGVSCRTCQNSRVTNSSDRNQVFAQENKKATCVSSSSIISNSRPNDKSCGICLDVVLEKHISKRKFGILPNCNHCFCFDCIKTWRLNDEFEKTIRHGCPECRVASDYIVSNNYWVDAKDKEKFIRDYRSRLSKIPCRNFRGGEGKCRFGNSCMYLHALPNGTRINIETPALRRSTSEVSPIAQTFANAFLEAMSALANSFSDV